MGKASPESKAPGTEASVGIVAPERFRFDGEFSLQCGEALDGFELIYETYGNLNAARNNAVLICHALSGNHHAAGYHAKADAKPGWWDTCIGPGKAVDTGRFFVVALNNLGGCHGSTGPASTNPATGKPFGADFPVVTAQDWVRSQALLADHLGIERFAAIVGGSLGGMQAMQWAIDFPRPGARGGADRLCGQALRPEHRLQRDRPPGHRIRPRVQERQLSLDRYQSGPGPRARAHDRATSPTCLTTAWARDFGRELKFGDMSRARDVEFQVESYLRYQGQSFSRRFDANTYLLMTRALDFFDPAARFDDDLVAAFRQATASFLVLSFTTDWRFAPARSKEIVDALIAARKNTVSAVIESGHGHDSFLLPLPRYVEVFRTYMNRLADEAEQDAAPGTPDAA